MTGSPDRRNDVVTLLKNPYPYKAMLAICSDLDETSSADVYFNTIDYLNSDATTAFGKGVNLEVGNTMYFYMPERDFAYWNATDREKERIRELIRVGLIDCFHSFGDLATTREQAARVLEHLAAHDCYIRTWVDHATARTNFGSDIMQGFGDQPESDAYHADLTLAYGVRHAWTGRVTSIPGQDSAANVLDVVDLDSIPRSTITAGKEATKILLGRCGHRKYGMHRLNGLTRKTLLRDGATIREFIRSNPNPGGVSCGDNAVGIGQALRKSVLKTLVDTQSRSIFYTHLGKKIDARTGFCQETREAFERLADLFASGDVLVTTTTRLLEYAEAQDSIEWTTEQIDDDLEIRIVQGRTNIALDGLSFAVPKGIDVRIVLGEQDLETSRIDDENTGLSIVMIPWPRIANAA